MAGNSTLIITLAVNKKHCQPWRKNIQIKVLHGVQAAVFYLPSLEPDVLFTESTKIRPLVTIQGVLGGDSWH